jgi:hypothetical protein
MPDMYVVLGLVHDLGKSVTKLLNIDMHYLVGDIFPLGCPFESEKIVHGDSFKNNPDLKVEKY